MALSVSEMATKPSPSRESPTMTIRLTSSAEPRSLRRFFRNRLILIMVVFTSIAVGRIRSRTDLSDKVAFLRHGVLTQDPVAEAQFRQCRRARGQRRTA